MTEGNQSQDYPIANQLDVGVNAVEDRVVLIATTKGHGRRAVLLTRRLMKSLLSKYAQVLEQTSETASQAAASHKNEVLQMEHISALSQIDQEGGGRSGGEGGHSQPQAAAPEAVYLATGVHFQPRDANILLAFDGVHRDASAPNGTQPEPALGFVMDRTTAHKVLAMLQEKADEAEWDLPKPSGWTDKLQQAKAGALN
jgi:hypothetical protein